MDAKSDFPQNIGPFSLVFESFPLANSGNRKYHLVTMKTTISGGQKTLKSQKIGPPANLRSQVRASPTGGPGGSDSANLRSQVRASPTGCAVARIARTYEAKSE